jgi:hypothetical protein
MNAPPLVTSSVDWLTYCRFTSRGYVSGITPGKTITMAPGGEPLSIESLLQKQKEEREAAARVSK